MKRLVLLLLVSTAAPDAKSLSYECDVDGQTVIQQSPCLNVNYPERYTRPSLFGAKTLEDDIAEMTTKREWTNAGARGYANYEQWLRAKQRARESREAAEH